MSIPTSLFKFKIFKTLVYIYMCVCVCISASLVCACVRACVSPDSKGINNRQTVTIGVK